jgi:hypothetical protein
VVENRHDAETAFIKALFGGPHGANLAEDMIAVCEGTRLQDSGANGKVGDIGHGSRRRRYAPGSIMHKEEGS